MLPGLEPAEPPPDAVEVGRIVGAWGIKGWFKIQPYSASPEALFSSRRWYIQPPEDGAKHFDGTLKLAVREAREHGISVLATSPDVPDRNAAEQLKGARIFVGRSSFPSPAEGEFYWVDLIGMSVVNREGVLLGQVKELLSNGPQDVLVLIDKSQSPKPAERLIPFVGAYIDGVELDARRITVDWQPDY